MDHLKDVTDELVWFGILHTNRKVSIKRYLSWEDYKEAGDSDFTLFTTRLFEASDRKTAENKAVAMIAQKFIR